MIEDSHGLLPDVNDRINFPATSLVMQTMITVTETV